MSSPAAPSSATNLLQICLNRSRHLIRLLILQIRKLLGTVANVVFSAPVLASSILQIFLNRIRHILRRLLLLQIRDKLSKPQIVKCVAASPLFCNESSRKLLSSSFIFPLLYFIYYIFYLFRHFLRLRLPACPVSCLVSASLSSLN